MKNESLDHLIYDGCGGEVRGDDGSQKGSVRPTASRIDLLNKRIISEGIEYDVVRLAKNTAEVVAVKVGTTTEYTINWCLCRVK